MPTNLPPEYFEADKRYREASTPEEKILRLEELLSTIPKHKGTDHLRADLRNRLAKLKASAQTRKKSGSAASAYQIDKEGAGQVVLVGPTNTGKSSLITALTNALPEVSATPYTTRTPMPGMMMVENVPVQLVDTPALDRTYVEPELFNLIRQADFVLLVVDLQTYPVQQLEEAIAILEERRIVPSHRAARYEGQRGMVSKPLLVLANKCDDNEIEELYTIFCQLLDEEWPCLPVSAVSGRNLGFMKQRVLLALDVIRVYAKPPGREPDMNTPFVLKRGSTVADLALKVHHDFYDRLAFARVWGSSAFDGQMVQKDYVLDDGDIVELRT
ncbi:MAG TPA: GTPase [Anaerolineales bacterium]|nr:GTPase [Anaerolineales bacterium]